MWFSSSSITLLAQFSVPNLTFNHVIPPFCERQFFLFVQILYSPSLLRGFKFFSQVFPKLTPQNCSAHTFQSGGATSFSRNGASMESFKPRVGDLQKVVGGMCKDMLSFAA